MRFLVIGASGAQGGAVARHLTTLGHEVRAFSRRTGGDLADRERVKEAFDGVTHASVVLPLVYDAATVSVYTRNVIAGALAAGVRRLAFNTGNRVPPEVTDVAAFETRRRAVAGLLDGGVPTVVLCPPLYADNLRAPWVAGPLARTRVLRYPVPAGVAVPWLSHADLGAATAAALLRDGLEGVTLDLAGPDAVTGPELAALFGPDVRYEEQDVAAFESGLAGALGAETAAGVAATYRWIRTSPDPFATAPGLEERLGVRLTPLREWVRQ